MIQKAPWPNWWIPTKNARTKPILSRRNAQGESSQQFLTTCSLDDWKKYIWIMSNWNMVITCPVKNMKKQNKHRQQFAVLCSSIVLYGKTTHEIYSLSMLPPFSGCTYIYIYVYVHIFDNNCERILNSLNCIMKTLIYIYICISKYIYI